MTAKKFFQLPASAGGTRHLPQKCMLTDQQLFQLCQRYGAAALEARRKFSGLLPEVYRRRLYERRGFESIFIFAAKLAGMSEEQVRRVLNLEKKFEDKPALRRALVFGEVSANKLARVASIATPENEVELAEKAKLLSKSALETLVRDEKLHHKSSTLNGFTERKTADASVPGHTNPQQTLPDVNLLDHLSPELQKNLIERLNKGININQLLTELLQKNDLKLAQEKEKLAVEANQRAECALLKKQQLKRKGNSTSVRVATHGAPKERSAPCETASTKPSRYIPIKIRRHLHKEHGTKCSIRNCARDARVIHHTQRFALTRTHDPRYLAPLCREHHEIAHAIDQKYHAARKL